MIRSGKMLVAALREAKGAKALNAGQLKTHLAKFPDAARQAGDRFLATLDASAPKQAAHLDALLADFAKLTTDVRRGQALFNGPKAACATCHRIGYVGGNVGPELTKIGDVRSERDLLESVVYPSASFVRNFEPTTVTLKDGDQVNGIVKRETPDELVIVTGAGPEQHLRRSEVTEARPGTLSIMPGGFDEQLSRQELADLLYFVKTVRVAVSRGADVRTTSMVQNANPASHLTAKIKGQQGPIHPRQSKRSKKRACR